MFPITALHFVPNQSIEEEIIYIIFYKKLLLSLNISELANFLKFKAVWSIQDFG